MRTVVDGVDDGVGCPPGVVDAKSRRAKYSLRAARMPRQQGKVRPSEEIRVTSAYFCAFSPWKVQNRSATRESRPPPMAGPRLVDAVDAVDVVTTPAPGAAAAVVAGPAGFVVVMVPLPAPAAEAALTTGTAAEGLDDVVMVAAELVVRLSVVVAAVLCVFAVDADDKRTLCEGGCKVGELSSSASAEVRCCCV